LHDLSLWILWANVQKALKNIYPHLPFSPPPPAVVNPWLDIEGYLTLCSNGTAELAANRTLIDQVEWDPSQGVCTKGDDIGNDDTPDAFANITDFAQVLKPSDFPADYWSSWSSWAGLLPTTTSAAPTPTATWSIAIYSEVDCAGDYYVLDGNDIDSSDDQCLVLRDGNNPQKSSTGSSCQWFTNGGFDWADCSTSNLTQPLSWSVLGGVCTVYDTNTCTDNGDAQAYAPAQGCHNYNASNFDTKTWTSLQCGAQPDIGELHERPLQIVNSTMVIHNKGSLNSSHTTIMTKAVDPTLHKTYRFYPRPTSTIS
jgi:chitinase